MTVIRTFVAVLIAPDTKAKMAEVQEQAKKLAPDVKWVKPKLLHVTLKFLGNVQEEALPAVFAAVDQAVAEHASFELSFAGLGAFPNASRARVIWIGTDKGKDELRKLAESIDKALGKIGYPREDRAFKAHVTIGRVKDNRSITSEFVRGIEEIDASELGSQQVLSVVVMQSELQREGPVYSPMSETKLI